MKHIVINNLTITSHDDFDVSTIESVMQRAYESINTEANHVNLVKINIGNMRADQFQIALRYLHDAFQDKGLDSCIFVPISEQGIQDIAIDRIEVLHESV